MKRTYIGNLTESLNQTVQIQGWVDTIRNQKKMQFLVIRDHTGMVQTVYARGSSSQGSIEETINQLTLESAVILTGKAVQNPHVKLNGIEVQVESIEVVGHAETPLPLEANSGLDARLEWRFLDLRRPANLLVFKVQTAVEQAMREFWKMNGFLEIHSPKLMGSPSESGAELFSLEYFGKKAYLAQSPQFYKQMAMSAGFDRIFEIGPVFRANPSFTSRHDTEFTSVDVEVSWVTSHEDVMNIEERWLQFVFQKIKDEFGEEIKRTCGMEVVVPEVPFPRIALAEAHRILEDMGHKIPVEGKGDLDPEGERLLAKYVMEKKGHEFVFVTEYPITVRPFYHMRLEGDATKTKSFDLLWRGLEVTTGAQREHRYEQLKSQALEKGLTLDPIKYYLDFFRYGCPPHGGYGFGLTRMLMIMLGFKNVREVTYLYRGPNRLSP